MQVMWPGKYFSSLVSCTLEWWKRQLKLFQESALSLVIKGSDISPLPPGRTPGSSRGQEETAGCREITPGTGPPYTQPWARMGPCAKIPGAECNVMSKRMPIVLSAVFKQEHIYIQWCAACPSSPRRGWQPLLGWPRGRGEPAHLDTAGASPLLVRRMLLEHFLVTRSNSPEKVNCEVKA